MENNWREEEKRYKRNGTLIRIKLLEFIPYMIMTNLSILLITSVDGIVVGNLVSDAALSAISIFSPIVFAIGIFSVLVSAGISTSLSIAMGKNNLEEIQVIKKAALIITLGMALLVALTEYPIIAVLIRSYQLSPAMNTLIWEYAEGLMIALVLGVISSVGTLEFQIMGKMRVLMILTIVEGVVNLALDLFTVAVLGMGIAGAGYSTACANLIRCSLTVLYLWKKTDIFRFGKDIKIRFKTIAEILSNGIPATTYNAVSILRQFFMIHIILHMFGEDGGTIHGVCTFCLSLASVIIGGIHDSMRPLMGLFSGADDRRGLSMLMQQGRMLNGILISLVTITVLLFPRLFFLIHGVLDDIPLREGILALQLFSLSFPLVGINMLFILFFTDMSCSKFATLLTLLGNATLPLFAFILSLTGFPPVIWLAYLFSNIFIFLIAEHKYKKLLNGSEEKSKMYLSLAPKNAVEASEKTRQILMQNNLPEKTCNRIALCIEEMVYYIKSRGKKKIHTQIYINTAPDGSATFLMLDDGECLALNNDEGHKKRTFDNYEMLRKVAKSFEYQYLLNMNYTVIKF